MSDRGQLVSIIRDDVDRAIARGVFDRPPPPDFVLPQHLERPRHQGETFGTLRFEEATVGGLWVIEGEPAVVIMAKRLFPGSQGKGRGIAKFPANRRIFGDLVWLMQRWPIAIAEADRDRFEAAYRDTVAHVEQRAALVKAPRRTAPAITFKGTLRPFQEEGLAWALQNQRTLIADEMGLGKTVQGIAFLATQAVWPALIVPPPHLVPHWEEKLGQFLAPADASTPLLSHSATGLRVHTIRGLKPTDLPEADIYIVHYLLLSAWRSELVAMRPGAIVFDEIQELRTGASHKYSAASLIAESAPSVVGLSGTPIYNRGGEIWNVLNIIDYHCLGDWDSFTREWCEGYGSDVVTDPALLGEYLKREGLMIRRRKEDVMGDLPPKRRIIESIDADAGLVVDMAREAALLVRDADAARDVLERGRLEREAVNLVRHATGIAKAPAAAEFVRGLLTAGEPTLVFFYHHDVADMLREELADFAPVRISGRETATEKHANKQAFVAGATDLCLINLRAATGIDGLQERARIVVFVELDWSPAVHSQGEDRAHRDGQRDSVLAYYLISDFGTDPAMQEALGLKVSQFLGLTGDRGESEEDKALAAAAAGAHMKQVIARIRAERQPKPAEAS